MSLLSFFSPLKSADRQSRVSPRRCRRRDRSPAARFVPRLEALESRALPSTLTVLNNADSGDGSLRAAIAAAQSGDQIVFDGGLMGKTITLTSGQLALTKSLDIEGPGAEELAVSGNHQSRVLQRRRCYRRRRRCSGCP